MNDHPEIGHAVGGHRLHRRVHIRKLRIGLLKIVKDQAVRKESFVGGRRIRHIRQHVGQRWGNGQINRLVDVGVRAVGSRQICCLLRVINRSGHDNTIRYVEAVL